MWLSAWCNVHGGTRFERRRNDAAPQLPAGGRGAVRFLINGSKQGMQLDSAPNEQRFSYSSLTLQRSSKHCLQSLHSTAGALISVPGQQKFSRAWQTQISWRRHLSCRLVEGRSWCKRFLQGYMQALFSRGVKKLGMPASAAARAHVSTLDSGL